MINPRKRDYTFSEKVFSDAKHICPDPGEEGEPANMQNQLKPFPLYLDYNNDTPLDPEVLKAIENHILNTIKTPTINWTDEIKVAIKNISEMISAKPDEIILTSSSSESFHIALKAAKDAFYKWFMKKYPGKPLAKTHMISTLVEPIDNIEYLKRYTKEKNIDLTLVPVNKVSGHVCLDDVISALSPATCLITISYVIPATGIIQPLKDISTALEVIGQNKRIYRPFLHSDIANVLGKLEVDVKLLGLDYATISGDKMYGPKIGALYYNKEFLKQKIEVDANFPKDIQVKGIRNMSYVVGLGEAALLISNNLESYEEHFSKLKKYFEDELAIQLKDSVKILSHNFEGKNICNVSCVAFTTPDAFEHLEKNNILSCNLASARNVGTLRVLMESGICSDIARQTMTISFGRSTTDDDLYNLIQDIAHALSPNKNCE